MTATAPRSNSTPFQATRVVRFSPDRQGTTPRSHFPWEGGKCRLRAFYRDEIAGRTAVDLAQGYPCQFGLDWRDETEAEFDARVARYRADARWSFWDDSAAA